MSKNKKITLTASELLALPISIGEARKLLGSSAQAMTDNEVALQILALSEVAAILYKNTYLPKMHL